MSKKRKKSGPVWSIVTFILAAAAIVGYFAWNWYSDNKLPNFRNETVLFVYPETTAEEAYTALVQEAGIKRPYSLARAFRQKQVETYIQPGRYEIKPEYSSVYVARMLNNCWQSPLKLVLSGTMRSVSQIASKVSRQLMIDSLDVVKALEDKSITESYGFSPKTVFSLFIPDTYEMYWTADIKDVLDCMKKAYDEFWTAARVSKAKEQGLSREAVSVLASIVTGETNYEPEMPTIAGVYLNRLHKGMKLQADPTIAYILDYKVNRILFKHLQIDSPYNTYLHEGLPPGPICVPSKAALEAVLNPEGDYMYFCANSTFDGTHLFAVNLAEHLKNARAFQSALKTGSIKSR